MSDKLVHVLLADDSEDDRLLVAAELRAFPAFQLAGATCDGVETIAWLNSTPPYSNRKKYPFPDLLLLDHQMPGHSGLDVLQWLHHQRHRPAVILWSHAFELINQPRAYQLGAALVCRKPDCRSDLNAILTRVFPHLFPPLTALDLCPTLPRSAAFDNLGPQ